MDWWIRWARGIQYTQHFFGKREELTVPLKYVGLFTCKRVKGSRELQRSKGIALTPPQNAALLTMLRKFFKSTESSENVLFI